MLHPRAFLVTVFWTLALLFLGSVVHATESSLACPDWPTCFGTMMPVMTGGVFWEHLHRLVAGGLLILFGVASWTAHRETSDRPWIFRACLVGLGLLLVQSLLGGITVIYRLPDAISTSHLGLAFLFLSLATVLASSTWRRSAGEGSRGRTAGEEAAWQRTPAEERAPGRFSRADAARLRTAAAAAAGLVFVQSLLGGVVRHTEAGLACPDAPLCLGRWVPPLVSGPVALHFGHRVLGGVLALVILGLVAWAYRRGAPPLLRRWAAAAAGLVLLQVGLGFASVLTLLAPVPVSLHTLVAASLLASLVHLGVRAHERAAAGTGSPAPAEEPAALPAR